MKGFLIILLALTVVWGETYTAAPLKVGAEQDNQFFEFVYGFLEGLDVKGDIKRIMECVQGGEQVINKIIKALTYLLHIDIKHMEEIMKGLKMLFEAVMEIVKIIEPCSKSVEEIGKLVAAILGVNLMKLVWKIIWNAQVYINLIVEAVNAFTKSEFRKAGHAIGEIMYKLFLDTMALNLQDAPAEEILLGFLEAIKNAEEAIKCEHGLHAAVEEIIVAIKLILTWNREKFIEAAKKLIEVIKALIVLHDTCLKGLLRLKEVIVAIFSSDLMKLFEKIVKNSGEYLKLLMDTFEAFRLEKYHKVGENIGTLVYKLFLEKN